MLPVQVAVTPNISAKESPIQCYVKKGDQTVVKNCSSDAIVSINTKNCFKHITLPCVFKLVEKWSKKLCKTKY